MSSKRISMSLFDDELKSLINASAKIFPMSEEDISNNLNPNNYEYAKVGRKIYVWNNNIWEYVIADDVEILWSDLQEKPLSFIPVSHTHPELEISDLDKYSKLEIDAKLDDKSDEAHTHVELHGHTNKSVLDTITHTLINTWNTVTGKSDVGHTHDDIYYTESELDTKLLNKSDVIHNHDGAYYKKSEVDTKVNLKEDKFTNRTVLTKITESISNDTYDLDMLYDLDDRLYLIEGGYSEGHTHEDITLLESITQTLIDNWNSAVAHITDTIKHITSDERTLWNTVSNKSDVGHVHDYSPIVHAHDDKYYTESEINTLLSGKAESTTLSGHTGNTITHVTQTNKDSWNGKAEISDIPTKLSDLTIDIEIGGNPATVGIVKPTDGSIWFQELI